MKTKCKLIFLALISVQSYAGIMPSQSRIVYHQLDRDQAIMLANTNDYPVIVQTWIDKGEGSPDSPIYHLSVFLLLPNWPLEI